MTNTETPLAILHKHNAAEFCRLAKTMMLTGGRVVDALDPSHRLSPKLQGIIKSGVAVAAANDSNSGAELADYNSIAASFVQSLQGWGAWDTMLANNAFVKVPLRSAIKIFLSGATGTTPAELEAVAVSAMDLDSVQLEPRQSVAMVTVTRELLLRGDPAAFNLLGDHLRKAIAAETDRSAFATILEDTDITNITSTGLAADELAADLRDAAVSLETGSTARIYCTAPPHMLKAIAFARGTGGPMFPGAGVVGGQNSGITFLGSDALSTDAILLDCSQAAANSDALLIDSSENSQIDMSDTPTSGERNGTSLWQAGLRSLRARRFWAFQLLRPTAAVVIADVPTEVTA
jgi:Phage capsid family